MCRLFTLSVETRSLHFYWILLTEQGTGVLLDFSSMAIRSQAHVVMLGFFAS